MQMKAQNVLIRAILVLVVIFTLASCAQPPAATQPAATQKPAEPTAVAQKTYKDMTVGFIQTGSEGGWRAANTASFKETAQQLGLTLKFYDSQNDLAKQVAG